MVYIMTLCIYPGLNQLDHVSHNLAFGVKTCCLSMVLILIVALF